MTEAHPVSRAEAEAFIGVYNRVTRLCPGVPSDSRGVPVGRRPTAAAIKEATTYLRFCASHAFDPEDFLVARHTAIEWRCRLPLKSLHAVSDNVLDHYRAWGSARAADATRVVQPIEDYERPSPLSEAIKAQYRDHRDVCMHLAESRGWHPASLWCTDCRLWQACRSRLTVRQLAQREAYVDQ